MTPFLFPLVFVEGMFDVFQCLAEFYEIPGVAEVILLGSLDFVQFQGFEVLEVWGKGRFFTGDLGAVTLCGVNEVEIQVEQVG